MKNDRISLLNEFGRGDVDELSQYKSIVYNEAYRDFSPRTLKGINKNDITKALDRLASDLFDFIKSQPKKNQKDFDDWHKRVCRRFIKKIKNATGIEIKYGKAQKIVNVSFKYILSLQGADKYFNRFKYCHATLDSYTYSDGFYKKEVLCTRGDVKPKWSYLDEGDYFTIQANIDKYLKDKNRNVDYICNGIPLTSFEAEFYIYKKYRK